MNQNTGADAGAVAARPLGAAAAVVVAAIVSFMFLGNVLADAGDVPIPVREVREERLSEAAYADVELGAGTADRGPVGRPPRPWTA